MADESLRASTYAQRILAVLEPAVGRHTARRALDIALRRTGREVAGLSADDHEAVCEVLAPMLRTLVGRAVADRLMSNFRGLEL